MRGFLAGILVLAPLLAPAQTGVWGSRGVTRRFVIRGDRVFAADGRGVAVYDVSSSPIRRIAVAETPAESFDLTFLADGDLAVATRNGIDRYAVLPDGTLNAVANYPEAVTTVLTSNQRYVAGITATGITIWEADTMAIVRPIPLMQPAVALAWHRDQLIAAVPGVGLYFVDATRTDDPLFVAENARDVTVIGNTLYVASGVNGISMYDLTNDSSPQFVHRTDAGERNFARVAVSSTRLFAAELPDTISVYDISSGMDRLITRFKEPVQTMASTGTRLFVSGTLFDQFGLPTETGAPIREHDDSTPLGEFRDLAGPVSGVATDGTLAFVVDPPYFRIIDISITNSPRELSSLFIDGIGDRVKANGTQAIVFGRGDVQLIDVSNLYAPRLVNVFHALGGPPSTAAFGRETILEANPYSGFHVVDFSHFDNPTQIGGIKGHYYDVASNGGDVAWVMEGGGLVVVDLGDLHNPQRGQNFTIGGVHSEMMPATEHHPDLLAVQTLSGLRIYTLLDPRNLVEASFMSTSAVGVMATDADFIYLATPGSVQVLSLTTPSKPTLSIMNAQPKSPMQMAAAKGKLVIADRYSLRVYGPNSAPPPEPPSTRRRSVGH